MNLLCQNPAFWQEMRIRCTGTVLRRKTLSSSAFLAIPILLPPLDEQRRIVDLIAAVDEVIEAATACIQSLSLANVLALADTYNGFVGNREPVDSLAEHIIGGSWGSAPGVEEQDVIALGTSAFLGDPVEVDQTTGSLRSLSPRRAKVRSLQNGDIVLERSGGSAEQAVGRVIQAREDLPLVVPSDFMRLIRIERERADPTYVFWVLWLRYQRGETLQFQTQGTNIRNLKISEYLSTSIAVPSKQEQYAFVALAEAALAHRLSVVKLERALVALRSALLAALLSGDHEIPASYGALLSA
jgi:hypothetical protein